MLTSIAVSQDGRASAVLRNPGTWITTLHNIISSAWLWPWRDCLVGCVRTVLKRTAVCDSD